MNQKDKFCYGTQKTTGESMRSLHKFFKLD